MASTNYLGIQLQNTGSWVEQHRQVTDSSSQQQILRFFYMQGGQYISSAIQIYKSKTLVQLIYSTPICILGFNSQVEKLPSAFLRKFLGLPSCVSFVAIYLELGIQSVECNAWPLNDGYIYTF